MELEFLKWVGFGLSFLAAFFFSLFDIFLSSLSRIAFSRFLEEREKVLRLKILNIYDKLKISFNFLKIFFILSFFVYVIIMFPILQFYPLWLFISLLAVYFIFFDLLPRLLNAWKRKSIFSLFLSSFRIPYLFTTPILFISKIKEPEKESLEQREASQEGIQALIEEAREEGIIETEEGRLLKSVVEFGDTIVREIMTPRVEMACISKKSNLNQLRQLVVEKKHARIPVYQGRIDNIEGIVNVKDLLEYCRFEVENDSISPLIRPAFFIPESMKVSELLKEFQKRKQKLAIVVDEHGGVSGLVTMEDLMEEIVGEIQDEYDEESLPIIQNSEGDYIVLGDVEVEQLEELFEVELAEDEFITVGGLIIHHLGRLPEKGEKLEIKGLSLEIIDADQKKIKKLKIRRLEDKLEDKKKDENKE